MKLDDYYAWRGMAHDPSLDEYLASERAPSKSLLAQILESKDDHPLSELHDAIPPLTIPLMTLDDGSVACLVGSPIGTAPIAGPVVRWFLREVTDTEQAALFDLDARYFLASWVQELAAREAGLKRVLDEIGPAYEETYLDRDRRPRDFAVRPIRIACQNVLVGLAAVAQDSSFDGLSIVAWQTTEASHVATHEGNRALAALVLCDAFQNGGTMELRFDREAHLDMGGRRVRYDGHPEGRVPASLRRFGRSVGVLLGAEDRAAITPAEARELFLAVTPFTGGLAERASTAILEQGITPERLCFTLLSGVWKEPELDVLLAVSSRAASILDGGADWSNRRARQAEQEACRAAHMIGMLFRRLSSVDSAGADGQPRVVEDSARPVTWHVDAERGAVEFAGWDDTLSIPWSSRDVRSSEFVVFPRTILDEETLAELASARQGLTHALLVPADAVLSGVPEDVLVLRCPDRCDDIDQATEARLLTSRIARA